MSDDRVAVLLEDIQGKLTSLADSVSVLAQDMHDVKQTIAPIPQMAGDIAVMNKVLTNHSRQLNDHETRLQALEMPGRA